MKKGGGEEVLFEGGTNEDVLMRNFCHHSSLVTHLLSY